jgi:translation elongation factor EF-4
VKAPLLVVDASQGVEAQRLRIAALNGVEVVPVSTNGSSAG